MGVLPEWLIYHTVHLFCLVTKQNRICKKYIIKQSDCIKEQRKMTQISYRISEISFISTSNFMSFNFHGQLSKWFVFERSIISVHFTLHGLRRKIKNLRILGEMSWQRHFKGERQITLMFSILQSSRLLKTHLTIPLLI